MRHLSSKLNTTWRKDDTASWPVNVIITTLIREKNQTEFLLLVSIEKSYLNDFIGYL